jgi:hypothetical protein
MMWVQLGLGAGALLLSAWGHYRVSRLSAQPATPSLPPAQPAPVNPQPVPAPSPAGPHLGDGTIAIKIADLLQVLLGQGGGGTISIPSLPAGGSGLSELEQAALKLLMQKQAAPTISPATPAKA